MAISYSLSWEDPKILSEALNITKNDNVLSIVSGGENLLYLLLSNPKEIMGIDIKRDQIYLTKLKIWAIKNLEFEEFVKFLGFQNSNQRIKTFNHLEKYLKKEEIEYWASNLGYIKNGIIHCGKFEQYLQKFRKYCLPLIITKKRLNEFLSLNSIEEQRNFFNSYWNNRRFKFLFKLFFSKKGLESGRDKQYFKYSSKNKISDYYLDRAKHGLVEVPIKTNFFMHFMLTGTVPIPFKGHPYLDRENFNRLKVILKSKEINFIYSDIYLFLKNSKEKFFSKFNLSDIFEAKTQEEYEMILREIKRVSKIRGRVCYWNNLVNRSRHKIKGIISKDELARELYKKDRVHFYSRFVVEKIIGR